MSVVYFLLLIGVLVLIHELGHFIAAKLLDFRVLRFSLGFGRALVRIRAGETEYQLGVFPLGGYVRIAGEDPGERDGQGSDRSFDAKPVWQRLIVVFAGPLANLILPLVIYFSLFIGHTELPAAAIGDVIDGSPASEAGIRSGDQILAIDGQPIRYWEEVERAVTGGAGRELRFRLRRGERDFERYLEPLAITRRHPDGRIARAGIIGVTHAPFLPQVAVADATSPAAAAGLRTGDQVIAVEGRRVESDRQLRAALEGVARRKPHRIHLSVLRPEPVLPGLDLLAAHSIDLYPSSVPGAPFAAPGEGAAGSGPLASLGLVSSDLVVSEVYPGSPAEDIGLEPGAVVMRAGGEPISHWLELERRLEARGTEPIELEWIDPAGEPRRATLIQRIDEVEDELGHTARVLVFGAHSQYARGRGETIPIQDRFRYAASKAMERTGETVSVIGSAFWSILRGQSPSRELGGPITMYRIAAVGGERGFVTFLLIIALISVSVALINLLPIPVLDGGHLLVFAIEAIRGQKLTRRGHLRFAIAGYAIVGVFTLVALGNDIVRFLLP